MTTVFDYVDVVVLNKPGRRTKQALSFLGVNKPSDYSFGGNERIGLLKNERVGKGKNRSRNEIRGGF